jgi:hypothetical protein
MLACIKTILIALRHAQYLVAESTSLKFEHSKMPRKLSFKQKPDWFSSMSDMVWQLSALLNPSAPL